MHHLDGLLVFLPLSLLPLPVRKSQVCHLHTHTHTCSIWQLTSWSRNSFQRLAFFHNWPSCIIFNRMSRYATLLVQTLPCVDIALRQNPRARRIVDHSHWHLHLPLINQPRWRLRKYFSFNSIYAHLFIIYEISRSRFQLRLFCTSSIFFPGMGSFRTNNFPCPMEFPPTCEVRVNSTQITANLKGLKKKPGTAPPPDITKYSRNTGTNRVEMVYVNSQQPVQTKVSRLVVPLHSLCWSFRVRNITW